MSLGDVSGNTLNCFHREYNAQSAAVAHWLYWKFSDQNKRLRSDQNKQSCRRYNWGRVFALNSGTDRPSLRAAGIACPFVLCEGWISRMGGGTVIVPNVWTPLRRSLKMSESLAWPREVSWPCFSHCFVWIASRFKSGSDNGGQRFDFVHWLLFCSCVLRMF